jgi:hypothetical protein
MFVFMKREAASPTLPGNKTVGAQVTPGAEEDVSRHPLSGSRLLGTPGWLVSRAATQSPAEKGPGRALHSKILHEFRACLKEEKS